MICVCSQLLVLQQSFPISDHYFPALCLILGNFSHGETKTAHGGLVDGD